MADQIPDHLISTLQLVERAYPQGVPPADYMALLSVLAEHMCEENLAIVASHWGQDPRSRLNDVLLVKSREIDASAVYQRLANAGLDGWIEEEQD